MGMNYLFDKDIQVDYEIKKLEKHAANRGMKMLQKNYEFTWTNGKKMFGNLDHVLASRHIDFTIFSNKYEINVSGWRELLNSSQKPKSSKFINFVKNIRS